MEHILLPLVNWGMGVIIIGIFAIVCIVMAVVVFNLANSDKKEDDTPTNSEI